MPTAGKIFLYQEVLELAQIQERLEDLSEEIEYALDGETFNLVTDISHLSLTEKELSGLYSADGVEAKMHRSGPQYVTYTRESPFYFFEEEERSYVLIMAPKRIANGIANKLSLILHDAVGAIAVPKLNPRKLREFCEGSEAIKVLLFEEMDIPNLEKATMYGTNIVQMDLYNRFVDSGQYRYSVSKLKPEKDAHTIGIVRDGSVCIFTEIDSHEYVQFIKNEIVPMIL